MPPCPRARAASRTSASSPAHVPPARLMTAKPTWSSSTRSTACSSSRSRRANRPGTPSGRWFARRPAPGSEPLPPGGDRQARPGRREIDECPRPPGATTASGVVMPSRSRTRTLPASPPATMFLRPDARDEIILDAAALFGHDGHRRALERAWAWWTGDGTRGRPLTRPEARAHPRVPRSDRRVAPPDHAGTSRTTATASSRPRAPRCSCSTRTGPGDGWRSLALPAAARAS